VTLPSEPVGIPPGKICPIISAVSELKQFSEYPKCTEDCGWFDENQRRCSVQALADELRQLRWHIETSTPPQQEFRLDWSDKSDLKQGIQAIGRLLERLVDR